MSLHLKFQVEQLKPNDLLNVHVLLASHEWNALESMFATSSHPLTNDSKKARETHQDLVAAIWEKTELGTTKPFALYKHVFSSPLALDTALRVLFKLYVGVSIGYQEAPAGFWKTIYAITVFVISERITDANKRQELTLRVMQFWLLAWLNPLSVAPGRWAIASKFVEILATACKFTQVTPTHAGSGVAVADLSQDVPPVPFTRIPADWPGARTQLYINAQDAAFMLNDLLRDSTETGTNQAFRALAMQPAHKGNELRQIDIDDFVTRAFRVFGHNNSRLQVRHRTSGQITVLFGFMEIWSAIEHQNLPLLKRQASPAVKPFSYPARVVNNSEGGFLLELKLPEPMVAVGTLLAVRGTDNEPWSVLVVRWLEDRNSAVIVGCEILCNFAYARVAEIENKGKQHIPILTYRLGDISTVLMPDEQVDAMSVTQLQVDHQLWVLSKTTEPGQDWQKSVVIDVAG